MALPSQNRLKDRKDIEKVLKKGITIKGTFLFIKYLVNQEKRARFAVIIPLRLIKNVTSRNRLRRKTTEYIRPRLKNIKGNLDVVIMIKRADEENVLSELVKGLSSIKV